MNSVAEMKSKNFISDDPLIVNLFNTSIKYMLNKNWRIKV
jgi:hypothetical protein